MLGLEGVTAGIKNSKIIPVEKYSLKIMSVGFITQQDKALIWRGPLANKFNLSEMLAYPVLAEFPFYLKNKDNLTVKEFDNLSEKIFAQLIQ